MLAGAALLLVAGVAGLTLLGLSSRDTPSGPRAVIIDQLAITDPDPDFISSAATQLKSAGYKVDYYRPDEVTVELYRDLPSRGYKVIIIRSHATSSIGVADLSNGTIGGGRSQSVGLFTNELYRNDAYCPLSGNERRLVR